MKKRAFRGKGGKTSSTARGDIIGTTKMKIEWGYAYPPLVRMGMIGAVCACMCLYFPNLHCLHILCDAPKRAKREHKKPRADEFITARAACILAGAVKSATI